MRFPPGFHTIEPFINFYQHGSITIKQITPQNDQFQLLGLGIRRCYPRQSLNTLVMSIMSTMENFHCTKEPITNLSF